MIEINETSLAELREAVMGKMTVKRFRHTVAVEQMVARLCALYCPEQEQPMRAAALLHDVTKEKKTEEQVGLCQEYGLLVTEQDLLAPKTFHARTAAAIIPTQYPRFASETVLSAVRWHTTGREGMTLTEKLLYLADYIDESRTFENCVRLRNFFFDADPAAMDEAKREALLRDTLILSYDMTVKDLLEEGLPVAEDTLRARNELLLERQKSI